MDTDSLAAPRQPGRTAWVAALSLLVAWTVAAYHGSFSAPFVFDDTRAIIDNPSIRRLWPPGPLFSPPPRMTVSGRPLVNISLALNYAAGGFRVEGYHLVNLLVHLLGGLTLAGLVRRTAARGGLRSFSPEQAGFATALLWLLHPLQTEAVTYVVQRVEALAALFYLLTLYGTVRYAEERSRRWAWWAVAACAGGMASKEVMVSAPLVAFLYDRTFLSGSFAAAWRRHRLLYAGLAATWALPVYLIATGHGRGGSVALDGATEWWRYALTQGWAILHYLRLTVWPRPLVIDYGAGVMTAAAALPSAAAVLALFGVAAAALRRWPVAGFLGCAFFAILAPSSGLVAIVTETAAEHRMYLPLAVLAAGFILILDRLADPSGGSATNPAAARVGRRSRLAVALCVALAGILSVATARRNDDYRDPIRLWQGAADADPNNPRAQANLAEALGDAGRYREAVARCREALRLTPGNARIWFNLGQDEALLGNASSAIAADEAALRIEPDYAEAQANLGVVLEQAGRDEEALDHFRAAVRLAPADGRALDNLGIALARGGKGAEGRACFEGAVRLNPADATAHLWLGNLWAQDRRTGEAEKEFAAAVRLGPADPVAHNNWGSALFELGRLPEAAGQFEAALRLRPDYATARAALARVRAQIARRETK